MTDERFAVAKLRDGGGVGLVVQSNAHYSVIEFYAEGHRWRVEVDNDEYEVVGHYELGIGYKEIT